MKTLLKKHPPIETVAAILREHSECLVVSDDGIRVRRTEPLPDIDLEDVQAHCRKHIAGYKLPRQLVIVDAIVRSPAGKPDYRWAKTTAVEALA